MPADGPSHDAEADGDGGTGDRSHQLPPAGDQRSRDAGHGGREDDVDAQPAGIRDVLAAEEADQVGGEPHGHDERGRDPVPTDIGPTEAPEVRQGQPEGLVGQDVGHRRALDAAPTRQPWRQRCRVQDVPCVEEGGQQQDGRPRDASGDQADGGELGRSGQHEGAHRQHLDQRVVRGPGGQPVDQAEGDGRDREPGRVQDQAAPSRPQRQPAGLSGGSFGRRCRRRCRRHAARARIRPRGVGP